MSSTPHLMPLPLTSITPSGWLLRQLQIQAEGFTGHIEDLWPDVGPNSAWLGGTGEAWERGPYYLDGLVPLAFLLNDDVLIERARTWVDAILRSARPDGQFGTHDDDWWPRMVALKVLSQWAEATGDERVELLMESYFDYQLQHLPQRPLHGWAAARAADNVVSVLWLHHRRPHQKYLDLARLLMDQGLQWSSYLASDHLITGKATIFSHLTHGPNVAMGLKYSAMLHALGVPGDHHGDTTAALENLERWHGQVHGLFSGDEWLAGPEATQGVETCQVVESMFSLGIMARAFADPSLGDLLEGVAYNLLPASSDALMRAHQYHQQANQIEASIASRPWSFSSDDACIFGQEPHFGCCTANYHQGWPKFVAAMWATDNQGSLTALAYGPCEVRAAGPTGDFAIEVTTEYPFDGAITITVTEAPDQARTMRLRVPRWAEGMVVVQPDGSTTQVSPESSDFISLSRTWRVGDSVRVALPMKARRVRRAKQAIGVRVGPLVMAWSPGELWRELPQARGLGEWEVFPAKNWNVGLLADAEVSLEQWHVSTGPAAEVPFALESNPVSVHGFGNTVPSWKRDGAQAGPLPDSPSFVSWVGSVTLVPYGCARLRVSEFPTVIAGRDAKTPWGSGAGATALV